MYSTINISLQSWANVLMSFRIILNIMIIKSFVSIDQTSQVLWLQVKVNLGVMSVKEGLYTRQSSRTWNLIATSSLVSPPGHNSVDDKFLLHEFYQKEF